MNNLTKEYLGDIAGRLSDVAVGIGLQIVRQFEGKEVDLRERFFHDLLKRQVSLLRDVEWMLKNKSVQHQQSTFILARCLLDDFIIALYMQLNSFDEEAFICHTAEAYRKRYSMLEDSIKMNDKYFQGIELGLVNREMYEKEWQKFLDEPYNSKFFKEQKTGLTLKDLKTFDSTASIIRNLPNTPLAMANAHAFILWRLFSAYVHFSTMTSVYEQHPATRKLELIQLREVFSYTYKLFAICSEAFKFFGVPNEINDPTEVFEEIMKDYRKAGN